MRCRSQDIQDSSGAFRPPRGSRRTRSRVWLALLVAAGLTLPLAPWASGGPSPSASGVQLSVTASGPGAIALSWSVSATLLLAFDHYEVFRSTVGSTGPWAPLQTLRNATDMSFYWEGLTPGTSYWWEVGLFDSLGGNTSSNIVEHTQPGVAALTGSRSGSTSANLSWTNSASYGPGLAFSSYTIEMAVDNGTYSASAPLRSESVRSAVATSLRGGAWYDVYVVTAEGCSGAANCPSFPQSSLTDSNVVAFAMPWPLTAQVTSASSTLTPGGVGTFACAGSGGVAPLKITWKFGDGTGAAGTPVTHAFQAAGTYTVACTVRDAIGSRALASTNVSVSAAGTGGNASGNGSGTGSGSGNGSSGSNGTGANGTLPGGRGRGSGGSGGLPGSSPTSSASPIMPALEGFLLVAFVAAVIGLSIIVARRGAGVRAALGPRASRRFGSLPPSAPGTTTPPPGAIGKVTVAAPSGPPSGVPGDSAVRRPSRGVPAHRPPGTAAAPTTAPSRTPRDLDELLDELEGTGSRSS
ncbi:MAG: PKD domain-containing protein [Thermoplasmata archaeon]|nr:PKD domain-containing protein [Thermoplasmata archaeon]